MNGFYWIYLAMIGFLLAYEHCTDKQSKRLIYYSLSGFLILLFALQDSSVSVDMGEYMQQWAIIPKLTFPEMLTHKFEIGYVLLSWLIERVFGSPRLLVAVVALLILVPYTRSFEEETDEPMVALVAFMALGMYLSAMIFWRQFIAMAILTYSYRYIQQRKFLPFLATVLLAMTFHKVAVVFLPLYVLYRIPVNKWLLVVAAAVAVLLNFFGAPIIRFGIAYIYPAYLNFPWESRGGYTLFAMMWVVVLLGYWLLKEQMDDPRIRTSFLVLLTAAAIFPLCFTFFWWLRVVLFFRVAIVPMTAHLYAALVHQKDNKAMALLGRVSPKLHGMLLPMYDKKWFRVATQLILFTVLFVWFASELDGMVYTMAPVF